MESWAKTPGRPSDGHRREKAGLTFGLGDVSWDEERVLERYEMLYKASLVPEAFIDRAIAPPSRIATISGLSMVADHRRILATAISRLRQ